MLKGYGEGADLRTCLILSFLLSSHDMVPFVNGCGSIENATHYFFHCIFFQHQRILLLNDIRLNRTPTLNLLLYGDPLLSTK